MNDVNDSVLRFVCFPEHSTVLFCYTKWGTGNRGIMGLIFPHLLYLSHSKQECGSLEVTSQQRNAHLLRNINSLGL